MSDRPTAAELAEAVREFLEHELLPALDDARLRFHTHVAINALGILERELESTTGGALSREEAEVLAARIRSGDVPPGTLALLKRDVEARLRIASPRYLDRYP
jgi:Domain of unknown function (DUF6285)